MAYSDIPSRSRRNYAVSYFDRNLILFSMKTLRQEHQVESEKSFARRWKKMEIRKMPKNLNFLSFFPPSYVSSRSFVLMYSPCVGSEQTCLHTFSLSVALQFLFDKAQFIMLQFFDENEREEKDCFSAITGALVPGKLFSSFNFLSVCSQTFNFGGILITQTFEAFSMKLC